MLSCYVGFPLKFIIIVHPHSSVIQGLNCWLLHPPTSQGIPSRKCKFGVSVSCRSLGISGQNMVTVCCRDMQDIMYNSLEWCTLSHRLFRDRTVGYSYYTGCAGVECSLLAQSQTWGGGGLHKKLYTFRNRKKPPLTPEWGVGSWNARLKG